VNLVIAPDGTPYLAYADQNGGGTAMVLGYDRKNDHWEALNSRWISDGYSQFTSLAVAKDGTLYLAFKDSANGGQATVVTFDKKTKTWKPVVGQDGHVSAGPANFITMAVGKDGVPYVAYADASEGGGNKATVMGYVNTPPHPPAKEWHILGNQLFSSNFVLAPDGTLYVAFTDQSNGNKASVMTYNKVTNQWQYIGVRGFSNGEVSDNSLAIEANGTLYLAFRDLAYHGDASVMTYNKSNNQWEYVGQPGHTNWYIDPLRHGPHAASKEHLVIASDGKLYLSFIDGDDSRYDHGISVMTYDKSAKQWQYVGQHTNPFHRPIPVAQIEHYNSLAVNHYGGLYLAFDDLLHGSRASVMTSSKSNNNWEYVGPSQVSEGATTYGSFALDLGEHLYLAFADGAHEYKSSVMTYNKSDNKWQYIGQPGFSNGRTFEESLAVSSDNQIYLAFGDEAYGGKASVMTYNTNKNQWQYVGQPGLSDGICQHENLAIAPDGTLYLAFVDVAPGYKATFMAYY
jgi:hypothetical protein